MTSETLKFILGPSGAIDWPKYHKQRAEGLREVAASYRDTAAAQLKSGDADWAAFSLERANQNENWAREEETLSQMKG